MSINKSNQAEKAGDYLITRSIQFSNDRGFAFGEHPRADGPQPFGTWQFTAENGKRDFYWGHYHRDQEKGIQDYQDRINEYMEQFPALKVVINPLAAAEMSCEQNYNQIDGQINNLPSPQADLNDGQTYEEIKELAPEMLLHENEASKTNPAKPLCRKFEQVDILVSLGAVVDKNTLNYKTDFDYDKDTFLKAVHSQNPEDKHFLWLSRNSGTECFKERDVFIQDIHCHNAWVYYKNSETPIVAFAVEVTGITGGKVLGNLYELDYPHHVEQVLQKSQRPEFITFHLNDGTQKQFPFKQYLKNTDEIHQLHDKVSGRQFVVWNEAELQSTLQKERLGRYRLPSRSFSAYIKTLPMQQRPSVLEKLQEAQKQVRPPAVGGVSKEKQDPER